MLEEILSYFRPRPPTEGPPLPSGLDISWPGFIARGIQRITTEGVKGPYKTIKEKGLGAEIKREVEVLTGVHLGNMDERDMLVSGLIGEGAIPLHGRENRKEPCTGCRIDPSKPFEVGNFLGTTRGAIGTLSKAEVRDWCSELIEESDGRCRRAMAIRQAAKECKEKYPTDSAKYFGCFLPKFTERIRHE